MPTPPPPPTFLFLILGGELFFWSNVMIRELHVSTLHQHLITFWKNRGLLYSFWGLQYIHVLVKSFDILGAKYSSPHQPHTCRHLHTYMYSMHTGSKQNLYMGLKTNLQNFTSQASLIIKTKTNIYRWAKSKIINFLESFGKKGWFFQKYFNHTACAYLDKLCLSMPVKCNDVYNYTIFFILLEMSHNFCYINNW